MSGFFSAISVINLSKKLASSYIPKSLALNEITFNFPSRDGEVSAPKVTILLMLLIPKTNADRLNTNRSFFTINQYMRNSRFKNRKIGWNNPKNAAGQKTEGLI